MLISKIPYFFAPPTRGDVVAFHQPGYGTLIKRIEALTPDGTLTVMGTHPDSVDSRTFGPVRQSDLLGKVIWHIRRS